MNSWNHCRKWHFVIVTPSLIWNFYMYLQRKLDGYKFPVYTTEVCPRNETEWLERSSLFNCTGEDNTYACFPNDDITELIEFCYPLQIIAIPPGKINCELGFYFRSIVQSLLQNLIILSKTDPWNIHWLNNKYREQIHEYSYWKYVILLN